MTIKDIKDVICVVVVLGMLSVVVGLSLYTGGMSDKALSGNTVIRTSVVDKQTIGGIEKLTLINANHEVFDYKFNNIDKIYNKVEVNKSYDMTYVNARLMYNQCGIIAVNGENVENV